MAAVTHPVAMLKVLQTAGVPAARRIWRMDPLTPTLLLCLAALLVGAGALTAFEWTQHSYRGFQWWLGALWLNVAGAGLIAAFGSAHPLLPVLQLLFMPWPLLCLVGLRRFHARRPLPGDARVDLGLLGLLLVAGLIGVQLIGDSRLVPLLAAGAAALHAAVVCISATPHEEGSGLRSFGALWLLLAVLPLLAGTTMPEWPPAVLQLCSVTLASMALAFLVLTLSSRRTERELRQSRRRLRVLANIDMLTQVPNRRRFEELARRALQAEPPDSATLLLVDIDHFKQINDKLGHAAGDRALKLVSRCTLDMLRAHDVAGRHGGDEFVLLLRRTTPQEAMQVAERLVAHLQLQSHAHALPRLSLSFGIVQMRSGENIDDTLQRADLALYEAKRLGRSRAVADLGEDVDEPQFQSSERLGLTSS